MTLQQRSFAYTQKTKIMTSAIMWFENIENEIDIDRWAVGDGYENVLGLS